MTEQILSEARHYFALYAALEPFRDQQAARSAAGLLHRSIEERLKQTLERLFRLMGLRYPPIEMHSAWLAVTARRKEQFLAALEFLDTVLEPRLKRVVLPMLDSTEHVVRARARSVRHGSAGRGIGRARSAAIGRSVAERVRAGGRGGTEREKRGPEPGMNLC